MQKKRHGRVFGIIAIKGGVGKTTVATNLAATLAHDYKQKTLIIDANFTVPTAHIHVGLFQPEKSLHDIMQAQSDPTSAIHIVTKNLHILPGTLEERNINPLDLSLYMQRLKERYDVIVIDASPQANEEMGAAMNAADELLVVTTPDHVALAETMHAIKMARKRLTFISGIILNQVKHKKHELNYKTIQEVTATPVMGIIDKDVNFLQALQKTTPYVHLNKKQTDARVEYKKLAAAIVGQSYKDTRLKTKVKRLFNKGIKTGDVNRTLLMKSHYE